MSESKQKQFYYSEACDLNIVKCEYTVDKEKFLDAIRLLVSEYDNAGKGMSNIFFCFESVFTMEIINRTDAPFPNMRNFKDYFNTDVVSTTDRITNPGAIYGENNFERENDHIILMINKMNVNDRSIPSVVAHGCKEYFRLMQANGTSTVNIFLRSSDFIDLEDACKTGLAISCTAENYFEQLCLYIIDDTPELKPSEILWLEKITKKKKNKKKKRG